MSGSKLCLLTMLVVVLAYPILLSQNNRELPEPKEPPSAVLLPVQSKNPDDVGVGKLLVASRNLADPNFAQTVVLLVRSDTQGLVGLVLNRRSEVPLSHVLDEVPGSKERSDPVYLGGPVETAAVFALFHSTAKLDEAEQVFSGTYLISTKTPFEKAIAGRPDAGNFHVYLGYSGWSNEQIRREIRLGSWFVFPGDAQTIFDADPDTLWRRLIEKTEFRLAGNEPGGLLTASPYADLAWPPGQL